MAVPNGQTLNILLRIPQLQQFRYKKRRVGCRLPPIADLDITALDALEYNSWKAARNLQKSVSGLRHGEIGPGDPDRAGTRDHRIQLNPECNCPAARK